MLELKANGLLQSKTFTNINTFTRTNYLNGDTRGNQDVSLARIQLATGIRLMEDLGCLDYLLSPHAYTYRVMGEEESVVRGKRIADTAGEMEMAYGSLDTMEPCDWDVLNRLQASICEIALQCDTAIVLPLGMKGHIDHFVVREAGIRAKEALGKNANAVFYFAEDKPYAGLLNEAERKQTEDFIRQYNLVDLGFKNDPAEIVRIAHLYYTSQVDRLYKEGIACRSEQLRSIYGVSSNCDRIYTFKE
ncbi:MAG: hypothetical protein WCP73_03905 [Eubacteriales bacterium]